MNWLEALSPNRTVFFEYVTHSNNTNVVTLRAQVLERLLHLVANTVGIRVYHAVPVVAVCSAQAANEHPFVLVPALSNVVTLGSGANYCFFGNCFNC